MALINCNECGKEISDKATSCPHCGAPIYFINSNDGDGKKSKKPHSTLSIWALVLSIFVITCFVGVILALVDLCKNDKTKKHVGSWVALVLTILYAFFVFGSDSDEDKNPTISKIEYNDNSSINTSKDSLETKEYGKVGDCVTGEDWKISLIEAKEYSEIEGEFYTTKPEVEGNKIVVLFFEVENIGKEDNYFNWIGVETYVDSYSVEMKTLLNNVENYEWLTGDVASGKKLKGYLAYEVKPDWNEIEISYKNNPLLQDKCATFKVYSSDITK